ncbi:Trans-1:2-dihydrobenzene-1:2-diol dehydrogenase-like protein [Dinothrombium tinctorium]|uniref:Trans-1,2-dihydrobenzene-1,2-diol dehydrogenase n=1 Tax=Dinothrombium tinctorium TaxID=1965070 RepID=A0A3S3SEJ3_9ACAR|nr:Trans-1:2-dihydrobenzene-1:2-diol dehydrogenase-like protein [Dinothrombium tinctorium]RWS14194.1 Trans-1:2-dihydrobenzene-1:2-diol dehydrogenase-like protein [Dinothrombium tinctorium]RWS14706.1 Trans-1:2-dihydrobenzene-1:2-diol dehydrogenase-like protein [Dinothrombium tinctorium]
MATKWGIASGGKISHDFVVCLRSLPSEEHTIVAVATRSLDTAQKFAAEHQIGKAYGSYQELADDPDVEVVYIGSINTTHASIAKIMMEKGKHLLIEKPMTLNLRLTTELINIAKSKNLFLMEAIWSRFLPAYKFMMEQIESGVIGEVHYVDANFGVNLESKERVMNKELGGGTILDLGVYAINLVLMALKGETPREIKAVGFLNESGVDASTCVSMKFAGNRLANISTHSKVQLPCEARIVGINGTIKLPYPMWAADKVIVNDKLHEFTFPDTVAPCNFTHSSGLRYEAMEVRRCLQNNLIESPFLTHRDSQVIAAMEDEIRKQIGVVYDQDT